MKKIIISLLFLFVLVFSFAQNRRITRGADAGELYLTNLWYGTFNPFPPFFDTLRSAVYRFTENGKKISIQYNADYLFPDPEAFMIPNEILADAAHGVIYNVFHLDNTSLWVSFDYGKNWLLREYIPGSKNYFTSIYNGLIFRNGNDGFLKSNDYGNTWNFLNNYSNVKSLKETFFEECEFLGISGHYPNPGYLYYTNDCYNSYILLPIDVEFVFGNYEGFFPDVFRGGKEGEVYIISMFPNDIFKVSFSADTGHTFRHVYVSEVDTDNIPFFMPDSEPGVFYIISGYFVEDDNPWGTHIKFCVNYYRDYGETLVATYCHDLTKDFVIENCKSVTDLISKKMSDYSILLSWSEPESSLPVNGYYVFRNEELLNTELIKDNFYLDDNLLNGEYEYYVKTDYDMDCTSDESNRVFETIEGSVSIVNSKYLDDIVLFPNPTSGELRVTSYKLQVTDIEIFDIYGRNLTPNTAYLTPHTILDISHLNAGIYLVKVFSKQGVFLKKMVKQ